MRKKFISNLCMGVLVLVSSFSLYANDTLLYVNLFYPDNRSPLNNAILANLSPVLPQKDGKPCLTYRFNVGYKTENNVFRLYYNEASVDHPVVFQRFSLRDLLLPVTIVLDVKLLDIKQVVEQQSITVELGTGGTFASLPLTGKRVTRVNFAVSKIELGQSMLDRIAQRQLAISEYYSADVQIKLAEEDLKKIDFNNPDNNAQSQEFSNRVLKIVEQIKSKKLEENLHLRENDPLQLLSRLQALQSKALESKRELVRQSVDIHLEYYRLGLENLRLKNYDKARENFSNAIDIEPTFSAPYIRLAEIELLNGTTDRCKSYLSTAAYKTNISDSVKTMAQQVVDKLLQPKLDDIRLFRQQKNFEEGYNLLTQSLAFCDTLNRLVQFPQALVLERTTFFTQWLEKKIADNRLLLEQKQYLLFEADGDTLYQFHQANINFFENRLRSEQYLTECYRQLVSNAESLIVGNPSEALDILMLSDRMCKKFTFINCNPRVADLINSVFGQLYEAMINDAFQLFHAEKITEADSLQQKAMGYIKQQNIPVSARHLELVRLIKEQVYLTIFGNLENNLYRGCIALQMADSAVTIRKGYNFQAHPKERELTQQAAGLCLMQRINDTDKRIVAKRFDEAETLLNEAESLAKTYNLTLSNEVLSEIAQLRKQIAKGRCDEQQFLLQVQLDAAEIHIRNKNYPAAVGALNKAIERAKAGSGCNFSTDEISQKIETYKVPAAFQTALDEVVTLIQRHDFETAFANYVNIYAQYPDSVLSTFGLAISPIEKFAKTYDYTPFTLACIEILAEDGKTETALDLLYFLYEKDVPSFLTDKAQDKMGRSLAKRDVESYSKESNPKTLAYAYVRHDTKWFKKLINAYKSQWKILIGS